MNCMKATFTFKKQKNTGRSNWDVIWKNHKSNFFNRGKHKFWQKTEDKTIYFF